MLATLLNVMKVNKLTINSAKLYSIMAEVRVVHVKSSVGGAGFVCSKFYMLEKSVFKIIFR